MDEQRLRQIIRQELTAFFTGNDNSRPTKSLFDRFWSEYPRKIDKKRAQIRWNKLSPSNELGAKIIAAVVIQKRTVWKGQELKYIPHPATWLNSHRWADEVSEQMQEASMPQIRKPTDEEIALIKDN